MEKFVVFATEDGSMWATSVQQFSRYKRIVGDVVKYTIVNAMSAKGALISDRAYPVLIAAQTHRNLTLRGY